MTTDPSLNGEIEFHMRRWDGFLKKRGQRLADTMLVKPWIDGLREFGVKAAAVKVWSRGAKYPTELPFVIGFACPFSHRTPDRRGLARVEFVVEHDGWVVLDVDASCGECDTGMLENWLLTCPKCEAGEESEWHRADHSMSEHSREDVEGLGEQVRGDVSPLSFVVEAFERLHQMAEARWWVENTAEAIEDYRDGAWSDDWGIGCDEDRIEEGIARLLDGAMRLVAADAATPRGPSRAVTRNSWTDEKVSVWLERQTTNDGGLTIPASASQREAWAIAKLIEGHPPKNLIERAQTLRKH